MAKYYCGLCEASHHEQVEGASCPECGRKYCLDSIRQSFQAGVNKCPYCDAPFEWFPEIPISFKRVLRGEVNTETPAITRAASTTRTIESEPISTFEPNSYRPSYKRVERSRMGMGMSGSQFFMKNPMYIIMAISGILMMVYILFYVFGSSFTMMGP